MFAGRMRRARQCPSPPRLVTPIASPHHGGRLVTTAPSRFTRPTRRDALLGLATSAAALLSPGTPRATETTVARPDLLGPLLSRSAVGCMALFDPGTGITSLVGQDRAVKRFIPASTFKVPNSLIALEVGAVADEAEIIPYGGQPQPYETWQHDMSMREAIGLSAVPIYQELARRIGLARYRDWLARLDWGNHDPGEVVDRFWLDGPLEISAVEQTRFLARLARRELPASPRAQAIIADIIRQETKDGRALHAKTGICTATKPMVGWWVGWVARPDGVTSFALNMDLRTINDAPKRMAIGREILATAGIW